MNPVFKDLMAKATQLTRSGNLQEATQAIQRALQGRPMPEVTGGTGQNPARSTASGGLVLDGLTRMVPTPGSPDSPSTVSSPLDATEAASPPNAPPTQAAASDAGWLDGSFAEGGRTLTYKLYVPATRAGVVATPRGLILMLHGCTQGAADFAAGTQMNKLAGDQGYLVLYPEQAQPANAQKCWNWFKPQHQQRGRGEPKVLVALTQSVVDQYQVDPARVFVAGLSAGGAMADILGRSYPDVFAAVGIHSGLRAGAANDVMSALSVMRSGAGSPAAGLPMEGRKLPPAIVFHGDADSTVNVRNGDAILDTVGATKQATPGQSLSGQRYTRTVYADATGAPVSEHWQLHGAGHAWSGGSRAGTYTDPAGVNASAEMLRFFQAHPRRN